ncbi:hypothetical protein OIU77_009233 [Salix suchowensis]|uniref:Uncharacterized protein n=1 Tax=Salix suchowensis TaxID=1278906 RepID=A0ABQ9AEH1_9ROSI|nr:hypothetical protein OIU77_009233 [Salix suchowensis]
MAAKVLIHVRSWCLIRRRRKKSYFGMRLHSAIFSHDFRVKSWVSVFHNARRVIGKLRPLMLSSRVPAFS